MFAYIGPRGSSVRLGSTVVTLDSGWCLSEVRAQAPLGAVRGFELAPARVARSDDRVRLSEPGKNEVTLDSILSNLMTKTALSAFASQPRS